MLFLSFLSVLATASALTTSLYQYELTDVSANTNYPEGSIEYHCFDLDGTDRTYVRGTYGNFGYFEGAVDETDPLVFHVNWYETASGSLTPTMGAATLTYAADYLSVAGPFWSTGTSDIVDSYFSWGSINGALVTDDSTPAGRESILQKCLYPGATVAAARADIVALDETTAISGSSDQGENTLCLLPAGPAGGSWLGTYTYQYGDDDGGGAEQGNYGTNPFSFWGQSGMGFVGTWHASTGGYAGGQGTNLYTVVGTAAETYLVGFYCNVDADGERTDCAAEYYEVTAADENANRCPRYYRLDKSLDPLYSFASQGSDLSEGDYLSRQVPIAMAILFGCLSGVLLAVVIYLSVALHTANAAKSAHAPVAGREVQVA